MGTAITTIQQSKPVFSKVLFQNFLDYTDVKETTVKGYTVSIRAFIRWMQDNSVTNPTRENVKAYKEYLDASDYTAGTKRQYLRAVKHFFKWTQSENIYPNIADNIKGAKVRQDNTRKNPFTEKEIITVINSIDTSTETGKRNKAMILLCVTCGLRIIELQRANIADIAMKSGERIIYIQGKGHDEKDDYKKIVPEVWTAISDYLKCRPDAKKNDPLFTSTAHNGTYGNRIAETSFSTIIKNIFRDAGFDDSKLTAHSLRHTSVTMLLKSGATLQEAQTHARHSDPKTTEIYSHNIDRDNMHTEQEIYDFIFTGKQSAKDETINIIRKMSEKQAEKVLQFCRNNFCL